MELGSLVSIDVDAEIRKVAGAQLHGAWQWPGEWIRRAFPAGATRVSVTAAGSRLRLVDDGAPLGRAPLERLALLLDDGAPPEARHEALTALETEGPAALVALAGLRASEVSIRIPPDEGVGPGLGLAWRRGRRAVPEPSPSPVSRTEVELRLDRAATRQAVRWLAQAARFAGHFGKTVEVNGAPVPTAPLAGLHAVVDGPRPAIVSLTGGDGPGELWLLVDAMVADHVALARPPHFDAILELAAARASSPAALRAEASALVPALTGRFVEALTAHAARIDRMGEPARARLSRALLQAAADPSRRAAVGTIRFLRALARPDPAAPAERAWLGLDDLEALARPGPGKPPAARPAIAALDGRDDPERFVLDRAPTPILDEQERVLLAEVGGFRFRAPARLETPGPLAALAARLGPAARELGRGLLRPFDRVLPEERLSPAERSLLAALQPLVARAGQRIGLCAGRGPVRFARSGLHLLPRDNPTVRAAAAALDRDPAWLYPVALALLERHPPPSSDLAGARERWRRRLLRPADGRPPTPATAE